MHLAACDQAKPNDLDGRDNLSEENLAEFTRFFEAVLFRGELPRSDAAAIVGTGDIRKKTPSLDRRRKEAPPDWGRLT